jgi:DNA invertase Pin-like site-specific DNA recombinase
MHTCFAYIRVSTVKQGTHGVSLQEQRSAIEAYAGRNAIIVSEWFEEKETAAKRGRPVFTRMLSRLDSGEASGVIIHKIDRGARNLRDWADLGELIDKGLKVHFAVESLDLASRGGRLSADIQAVVAADFIRNLREETRKGFYGRLKQGLYPLAAPLGYLDTGKGKPKSVDPASAPFIQQAFELYATGNYSIPTLREQLKALGLVNKRGKAVSKNGVSRILNNPFYAGLIRLRNKGDTYPGIHQPLISMQLYQEVQDILSGRMPKRGFKHHFLFRQMVTCTVCGHHVVGERQKGHVYYRCHSDDCRGVSIREETIDVSVREALGEIDISSDEHEVLMDECRQLRSAVLQRYADTLRTFEARVELLKARLDRLADALVDGLIDGEGYRSRRASLLEDLVEIEQQKARFSADPAGGVDEVASYLERAKVALYQYDIGSPHEKRETVGNVTSNLTLAEKGVVVELRNPYRAIAEYKKLNCSDPDRDTPRTPLVHQLLKYAKENPGKAL